MAEVLLCGFEPYGGHQHNASAELARALANTPGLRTAVLPVSYTRAGQALTGLLQDQPPAALLLLGMWPGEALKLERIALNLDDSPQADTDGEIRQGSPIDPQAPVGYRSTLPLPDFERILAAAGLPLIWSRDAGGFVCNHVFFLAARQLAPAATACGLVHVPATLPDHTAAALRDCIELLHA